MISKMYIVAMAAVVAASAVLGTGCYSISSFQSARVLETGKTSVAVAGSRNTLVEETTNEPGESDNDWNFSGAQANSYEIMIRHGVAKDIELGGRYVLSSVGVHELMLEPKFQLIPERLALSIPTGFAVSEGDFKFGFGRAQPTLIVGIPLSEYAELDLAGKVLFIFDAEHLNAAGGFNAGLRIGTPGATWAIHPEVGIMTDSLDSGARRAVTQVGIALLFNN